MRICWDQSDEPHVPKPINDDLLHLCHHIFQDPEHEGIYLIARGDHHMIGFASLFWSWPFTHYPGRRAILSDLFVISDARGEGVAYYFKLVKNKLVNDKLFIRLSGKQLSKIIPLKKLINN
ncbi:unnamed protein product [Rotaria sordida]|uniref:N-acetyltransferase domain-containing protein n=1 Tax=Rotaria sordida TaxID=392033 RepID=A0A815AVG8_9BILA|nr:unnamed protein product [Rotaria sordida]CAF3997873.1 unnamed protein product [Rotaria sordida]